jgi:hypothetical protein
VNCGEINVTFHDMQKNTIQPFPEEIPPLHFYTRCEGDHSLPSCAEVKECTELYLHSPITPPWLGAKLNIGTTLPFTSSCIPKFNFAELYNKMSRSYACHMVGLCQLTASNIYNFFECKVILLLHMWCKSILDLRNIKKLCKKDTIL